MCWKSSPKNWDDGWSPSGCWNAHCDTVSPAVGQVRDCGKRAPWNRRSWDVEEFKSWRCHNMPQPICSTKNEVDQQLWIFRRSQFSRIFIHPGDPQSFKCPKVVNELSRIDPFHPIQLPERHYRNQCQLMLVFYWFGLQNFYQYSKTVFH